jgi:hypothetical protein
MPNPAENYDPRRFETTVPYYARYRLGYPELLIRRVVERVASNRVTRCWTWAAVRACWRSPLRRRAWR